MCHIRRIPAGNHLAVVVPSVKYEIWRAVLRNVDKEVCDGCAKLDCDSSFGCGLAGSDCARWGCGHTLVKPRVSELSGQMAIRSATRLTGLCSPMATNSSPASRAESPNSTSACCERRNTVSKPEVSGKAAVNSRIVCGRIWHNTSR